MVVHESSNFEYTSSDEQLSDVMRGKLGDRIEKMTRSRDVVDKRLMDLYIFKQAQKYGARFGFKNSTMNKKNMKMFSMPSKVWENEKDSDHGKGFNEIAQADRSIAGADASFSKTHVIY